jgi:hypothetical protein
MKGPREKKAWGHRRSKGKEPWRDVGYAMPSETEGPNQLRVLLLGHGVPQGLRHKEFSIGVIFKKTHAFYYWHWDLRNRGKKLWLRRQSIKFSSKSMYIHALWKFNFADQFFFLYGYMFQRANNSRESWIALRETLTGVEIISWDTMLGTWGHLRTEDMQCRYKKKVELKR